VGFRTDAAVSEDETGRSYYSWAHDDATVGAERARLDKLRCAERSGLRSVDRIAREESVRVGHTRCGTTLTSIGGVHRACHG